MADRRSFLRGLVTLPLIGGGTMLVGAPSAPVPLVRAAAVPALETPLDRLSYGWAAFSAAMREMTVDADGWCIVGAAERRVPLPPPYPQVGSFLRVAALHTVEEHHRGLSRPLLVERHREIDLGLGAREGWL